ncbi:MAG: hypothetical protein ACYC1K_01320 [Minisyncoccota bacterium]
MNSHHEEILSSITGEFPTKVEEIKQFEGIEPPVNEMYLFSLCEGDVELIELFDEMIEYFYRYTKDVCQQESLIKAGVPENLEEIRSRDAARGALHDAMIDSVKIFARNLRVKSKDASWIEPIDKKGRTGYANLALLTTFHDLLALNRNA